MTKILIVDDYKLIVEGLKLVLQRNENFIVVGEAYTGKEGIEKTLTLEPDIVIMDIRLPDLSGILACREIKTHRPLTQVVMLTSYADEEAILASLMAGAAGYVLKQVNMDILRAVERVSRGESLFPPYLKEKVLKEMIGLAQEDYKQFFTEQEKEVLNQILEGYTNKEITRNLVMTDEVVREHVTSILAKLDFENLKEAMFSYS